MRELLRGIPIFARPLPTFDPSDAPAEPTELFRNWLLEAIEAGVDEPHVMTLCTVDPRCRPDVRVVVLQDVVEAGWQFAANAVSAKGQQLAGNPHAALHFYWREQGRQVRIRGVASAAEPELVADHHTVHTVAPDEVEFWQGERDRRHVRLRYRRTDDGWTQEMTWP